MTEKKKSAVIYEDWARYILEFDDDAALQLSRAIAAFTAGVEYEIQNVTVKVIFETTILPQLSGNRDYYQKKKADSAERIRKWRESQTKSENSPSEQNEPRECNAPVRVTDTYESVTNAPVHTCNAPEHVYMTDDKMTDGLMTDGKMANDLMTDGLMTDGRVNTTYSPSGNSAARAATGENQWTALERMAPQYELSSVVVDKVRDWLTYKSERLEAYTASSLKFLLEKLKKACNEFGDERVVDVITESMASGYKGIAWSDLGKTSRASPNNDTLRGVKDWAKEMMA